MSTKDSRIAKTSKISLSPQKWVIFNGYLFLSPALIGFFCFVLGTLLISLSLSFCEWDLSSPPRFVGLNNYRELFFADSLFWQSLKVTLFYTVIAVPVQLICALILAILVYPPGPGISLFRLGFFIPSIVPAVANMVVWQWVFNTEYGLLNGVLSFLKIPKVAWLELPETVMPALWIMIIWSCGGDMLIFLAALRGLPKSVLEAAMLDGASYLQRIRYIILPMISPIILYNLFTAFIGSIQIFTAGYLLTNGGPGNSTLFYVLYTYRQGFNYLKFGYASALSWVLLVIVILIVVPVVFLYKKHRELPI